MKHYLLLCFFSTIVFAQAPIVIQADTYSRPMPLIGFNTNAHHTIANWKIPQFRDTVASLYPAILRYPGGTIANHWDWKRGWFQNAPTTPPELANINPKDTIRAEEFKLGSDRAESEALFVVNFQHSTLAYEVEGLLHAKSLGFSMKYIEIGNEHNLSISHQFIPPEKYADGIKKWSDSLKQYFPQSQICLVGGAPPATPGWHDSIFARNPNVDALAFHVYLGAGNSDSVFNAKRALSIPFAQLHQRYIQSKFSTAPPNVKVWVTEFNLSEQLSGTPTQHAETWTHALYVAAMTHIFLENKNITMIVNHNLTNQSDFAAISPFDFHVTANGLIMRLLGEVSKGMTTATRLSFPALPAQQYAGTSFPTMIGWKFDDGIQSKGFILNLSSDTIDCNFTPLFGDNARVFQYSADVDSKINGTTALRRTTDQTSETVRIAPYSAAQVFPGSITTVSQPVLPGRFGLNQNYPNPFNPSTTISFRLEEDGAASLIVYDAIGRTVATPVNDYKQKGSYSVLFDASQLVSGIYFFQLRSGGKVESRKMLFIK